MQTNRKLSVFHFPSSFPSLHERQTLQIVLTMEEINRNYFLIKDDFSPHEIHANVLFLHHPMQRQMLGCLSFYLFFDLRTRV